MVVNKTIFRYFLTVLLVTLVLSSSVSMVILSSQMLENTKHDMLYAVKLVDYQLIIVSYYYSKKTIFALNTTKHFLGAVANGDLTTEIDPYVLQRHDEIGDMGRFAVMMKESLSDLVGKDPLTGLHNRHSCDVVLASLIQRVKQKNTSFAVAMGDVDFFKYVNDTYGHQAGDETLRQLAKVISTHMEHLGFVFRWGGEELIDKNPRATIFTS